MGMTQTSATATQTQMTHEQATDEALLLLTRKLRRLHPEALAEVWALLSADARRALALAEVRADTLRDASGGAAGLVYPADPFDDLDADDADEQA